VLRGGVILGEGHFSGEKNTPYETGNTANKLRTCISQIKIAVTKILGALQHPAFSGFNTDTSKELSTSIFMVAQVTHILCLIFNFLTSNVLFEIRALSYRRFGTCIETPVRNYHYTLHNNPEQRGSRPLRGGNLKSRNVLSVQPLTMSLYYDNMYSQSSVGKKTLQFWNSAGGPMTFSEGWDSVSALTHSFSTFRSALNVFKTTASLTLTNVKRLGQHRHRHFCTAAFVN
jgi:hypothetical protein